MKDKISRLSGIALIALLTISALAIFAPTVKAVQEVTVEMINPVGDPADMHDFNFTSLTKQVGNEFTINITVNDADPSTPMKLTIWQVCVGWDKNLLAYDSFTLPSDHVFKGVEAIGGSVITPPPILKPGNATWGASYTSPEPWSFNGSGTLCQLNLTIIKGVDEMTPEVSCDLKFLGLTGTPKYTFLVDVGYDIPFDAIDGFYKYKWIAPTIYPTIWIKPAICKPAKLGDTVPLEIWVKDVDQGWSIIGFQFSLMWDIEYVEPELPYYTAGNLLETFAYPGAPDPKVLYAISINKHDRPLPLTPIPDGWNFSKFGVIMLPDSSPNPPYHPPFPQVDSTGKLLMTVYFKAISETIAPVEHWEWIKFIDFLHADGRPQDTYGLNQYIHLIKFADTVDCYYRKPVKTLGPAIDVYTQYQYPWGGQGGNATSDGFGPQQLVDLFAYVTYNEYPVQQKLVGFQIFHQGATKIFNIYREDTTDDHGVAQVSFRIPWPCEDPVHEIFGWWYVNATVEIAEMKVVDNLKFWVWWPVQVLSVEPWDLVLHIPKTTFTQRKVGGDPLTFNLTYGTYSMQMIHDAVITVTVYDEQNFFIGSLTTTVDVGWGDMAHEGQMKTYEWLVTIPMPTNALVGKGIVFGNAFDALPWYGGTPYCPEVTNTIDFYIVK